MTYEKSCGFVPFIEKDGIRLYLLIRAINGDIGFPKGHVEGKESEYQTAIRELKEETNIDIEIIDGFRCEIEYTFVSKIPIKKRVVYFLGRCISYNVQCQEQEVLEAMFLPFEKAIDVVSFIETRNVLKQAEIFLNEIEQKDKF